MKVRKLPFLLLFCLIACSDSGDGLSSINVNDWGIHFSPPEWIHGTWLVEEQDYENQSFAGFKFTEIDFLYKTAPYVNHSCSNDITKGTAKSGFDKTMTNKYQVTMQYHGYVANYEFTFISDSEIHGTFRRVPFKLLELEHYILFKQ